jgi:hypothetical protein
MGTWLTYGVMVKDPAVVITNVLTFVLVVGLVVLKAVTSRDKAATTQLRLVHAVDPRRNEATATRTRST